MKKQFLKKTGAAIKALMLFLLMFPGSINAQNYCNTKGVNTSSRDLWIEKIDLGTISMPVEIMEVMLISQHNQQA